MPVRLSALVLALIVAGSGLSPCAAGALAQGVRASGVAEHAAGDARHDAHAVSHAAHPEASAAGCHGVRTTLSPRCDCGCTGDLPRAAASAFAAPWALPAPSLPRVDPTAAPAPAGCCARAPRRAPSDVDHVPLSA